MADVGSTINPDNLLLVSVELDDLTIADGLAAYGDPEDPLLPLGEIARQLELDIDVFPAERRVTGRIGQARQSLLIDLNAGVVRLGAADIKLTTQDVAVAKTEIYVRASAMQRLLPLKVEVVADELLIRLKATELLPVQSRLQRQSRRVEGGPQSFADDEVMKVATPYRLLSPPGFDIVVGGGVQSHDPKLSARYDVRAAADVLFMNFQGYLASDENGRPSEARMLFQRQSLDGGLLGPLKARDLSFGDVFTPALSIGARSVGGRGLTMSTVPLDQSSVFNHIDLRGELPIGYDVELYVNDVLRGGQNTPNAGRYEFLDVPLISGINVIRIVTYGPRGERLEETRVINVGAGLLARGEANFQFGAVDQSEPLVRVRQLSGVAVPDENTARGLRLIGSVNYGLTQSLTISSGAALMPREGGQQVGLFTAGARTSLFGVATQLDAAVDDQGGSGAALAFAGRVKGISAVVRHGEYQGGFIDENNLGASPNRDLRRRTELTLDTNLDLRGRILPISLRVLRNGYTDGSLDYAAAARVSASAKGVLLSTGLEYGRQVYRPAASSDKLTGYLVASTFRGYKMQLRASFDYDILPELRARALSVSIDRQMSKVWSMRLAVGQPLDRLNATSIVLSSIFATRYGDLSLSGEYDNADQDWRIGAQLNFGLGYNPSTGRYQMTRTGPGSGGMLLVDAFVDENGDGVRQPNEPPEPNVIVQGAGAGGELVTDKNGRLYAAGMGTTPTAQARINIDKIENTSVKTPPSTVQFSPRPGRVTSVVYPMAPTGDVLVKLLLKREDGKLVGLSSVRVVVTPDKGSPAQSTTEFDGSAVFTALPVGKYKVELEPKQAAQLRMHLLTAPTFEIRGDGDFTPDVTAQVVFDPAADNPAAAPPPQRVEAAGGPAGPG